MQPLEIFINPLLQIHLPKAALKDEFGGQLELGMQVPDWKICPAGQAPHVPLMLKVPGEHIQVVPF
jgi:hypothetical protein